MAGVAESLLELESLVNGKTKTVELCNDSYELSREMIVDKMNNLVVSILPGCWFEGEFINKENNDYLIYDLHLSGVNPDKTFSSIRLLDFGDKFQLIKF